MARTALVQFGLEAVYIHSAEPAASAGNLARWLVRITGTDLIAKNVEIFEADEIAVALNAIGQSEEAQIVEAAASEARVRNRSPWSNGP